jgi:hypothetical protein
MRERICFCFLMTPFILVSVVRGQDTERSKTSIAIKNDYVDFLIDGKSVARYVTDTKVAKPFLWPVFGPGGEWLTRAWPMAKGTPGESTDHVHQKSVWFCHGDVIPEGIEINHKIKGVEGVDYWSEHAGHGVIRCIVRHTNAGESHLDTRNEWRTADGTKIMDEQRTIQLHHFGDARLFVIDIDLHASVCPITFGDTKEGSFGVRVNDAIRVAKGNGKIENADGKVGEGPCWGRVSAWCDYSGQIDGKTVGIAVLDDPKNPYPACWHVRAYGLMAANPFGRAKSGFPAMKDRTDLAKLAKGEHLRLRYGLLIHNGDAKSGKVAEHYQRFVGLRNQSGGN